MKIPFFGHSPVGVVDDVAPGPKVALSSQPWALGQNPFGIPGVNARAFEGVLLGDSLGLPAENLSPGRVQRLWKVARTSVQDSGGETPAELAAGTAALRWRMRLVFRARDGFLRPY
jgi:hypothetical protein